MRSRADGSKIAFSKNARGSPGCSPSIPPRPRPHRSPKACHIFVQGLGDCASTTLCARRARWLVADGSAILPKQHRPLSSARGIAQRASPH